MRATIARTSADNPAYDPTSSIRWATNCLNCGSPLYGAFCSECGQRAVPPHPTIRELVGDAFAEFSGFHGTLASTVRRLLGRPGELTKEVVDGRRRRYLSPLRLYLSASALYFLVAAWAPERQTSAIQVGALNGPLAVAELVPRVLFVFVPVFALIVGLFYRGRHYPEHLYLGLHNHAFVFLALTTVQAAKFAGSPAAAAVLIAVTAWIVYYILRSMRRVYGGSWRGTLAKSIGIGVLYGLALVAALTGESYVAALIR